jgi:hypothetical protein
MAKLTTTQQAYLKKLGPKPAGTGTLIGVRLQPDELAKVDRIAASEGITRPEAIRRMIDRSRWIRGLG